MSEAGRSPAIVTNFRRLSRLALSDHDPIIPGEGQPVDVRWVLKRASEGDTVLINVDTSLLIRLTAYRVAGRLRSRLIGLDIVLRTPPTISQLRVLDRGAASEPVQAPR